MGLGRLELPTSRLSSARSNQLSYKPKLLTRSTDRPPVKTARVRPRRKRNVDGGVPLIGSTGLNRSALMFLRNPIEAREALLKDHP